MKHFDYDWDLYPDRIVLDRDLNIDRLGWKNGDYFKVTNINGIPQLVKVDQLEQFVIKGVEALVERE
jgi:hypothetical protein